MPIELLGHSYRWPGEHCARLCSALAAVVQIEIGHGLRLERDEQGRGVSTRWSPSWSPGAASTGDNLDVPGFLRRKLPAVTQEMKT
jgi:hypothetical protein